MKILYLTPWFPAHRQDKTGNFILDSIESLIDLGHEVTVLVSQAWRPKIAGWINKEWIKKEFQLSLFSEKFNLKIQKHISIPHNYCRPLTHFFYRNRIEPALEKLIKKHQCQLIHAHTELAGLAAVKVGKRLGIPTVVTLHGIDTDKKVYSGSALKDLFHYTLNEANRVVLVGQPLVIFFKNFVNQDNHFRIVPNGFRIPPLSNTDKKKQWDDLRFISVSNLQEGKGIDLNLRALAALKKEGIYDWTYKIIGEGPERKKLEALTKELGLKNEVSFLGACDHHQVYVHLAESTIFSLPSYREAFGIAYLEAMACGLLTIGVEGQGAQAFIEHEKTGLLVPPYDVDSLIVHFKKLFESRERIMNIAAAGKKHVYNHFTWLHHAKKLTQVYEELIPVS